jgi:hypothetical protein
MLGLPTAVFCFLAGSVDGEVFAFLFNITGAALLILVVLSFEVYFYWGNTDTVKAALKIAIITNIVLTVCFLILTLPLVGDFIENSCSSWYCKATLIGVSLVDLIVLPLTIKKLLWKRVYPTAAPDMGPMPAPAETEKV